MQPVSKLPDVCMSMIQERHPAGAGDNPVNALYNTTYPSKIKPYAEDIKRLLSEGKIFRQISSYIREKGYKGADSTIRMYATRERKL